MSGIKDQENIDDLRRRLYARKGIPEGEKRHQLTDNPVDVARGWGESDIRVKEKQDSVSELPTIEADVVPSEEPVAEPVREENAEDTLVIPPEESSEKPKRSYRMIIILFSLGFFILTALASSVFLFFGGNEISTKNISITMEAPFAIAGGDVVPIQLGVSNQNKVPLESVILILNYPPGTKSADESARDLYEERLPIDDIEAGGVINIPIKVILFGEENDDKEINATIEYRVKNSNGTFVKDSEPLVVKINSSPLVLRVEAVEKISSGQEMEIRLTLQSNASSPMKNVLVSANYPDSFSYISSEPSPGYGQNEWLIEEILPESTYIIVLKGLITGLASEVSEIQFQAGNPKSDNKFSIGSILTQTKTSYSIEKPFIDVVVDINQDRDGDVTLNSGDDADVTLYVKNTLDETVYDMRVELIPKGNIIRDELLDVNNSGYYDSTTKKINWEISGMSSLEEVGPGESREFSLTIKPDPKQNTSAFDVSAKVFARRVSESRASEELIGTAIAKAKYSSVISIGSQIGRNDGPFSDSGPIPPVAGVATKYTVTIVAEAGVNDMVDGILTTSLPQHIKWLDKIAGDGKVEYNPVSKKIFWDVGDISAGDKKTLQIQVELLPSIKQVKRIVTIINSQELRATDRFTGKSLKATEPLLTSELSEEAGFADNDGVVQAKD
jgi:hypothetical protein